MIVVIYLPDFTGNLGVPFSSSQYINGNTTLMGIVGMLDTERHNIPVSAEYSFDIHNTVGYGCLCFSYVATT